jgi:hypothetical protein
MSAANFVCVLALAALAACTPSQAEPIVNAQEAARPAISSSQNLIYVADPGTGVVDIYSFLHRVAQINGFHFDNPMGLCVDRNQSVFVSNGGSALSTIYAYAHGATKPFKVLHETAGAAGNCASDPLTGNLAVANSSSGTGSKPGPGNVVIFSKASGTATQYTVPNAQAVWYAAYDLSGNLFVDGVKLDKAGILAELPKGATSFRTLTVNVFINPGALQWVEGRLCLLQRASMPQEIDQFSISGTKATKTGATVIDGDRFVSSFFVATYASGNIFYHRSRSDPNL